jgi:hypothetical protein
MWHRHMNVEIGTQAGQIPENEYINGIFVAVIFIIGDNYNIRVVAVKKIRQTILFHKSALRFYAKCHGNVRILMELFLLTKNK